MSLELEPTPPVQGDIAYHYPFDWGALQVTEGAHEAYGLVPFILRSHREERPVEVEELHHAEGIPGVVVNLVAPEESPEFGMLRATSTNYKVYSDSVQLDVGFSGTSEEFEDEGMKLLLLHEMIARDLPDGTEFSINIDPDSPDYSNIQKLMAHTLPVSVEAAAKKAGIVAMEKTYSQEQLQRIRNIAGTSLVFSGVALSLYPSVFEGPAEAAGVVGGLVIAGRGIQLIARQLKNYHQERPDRTFAYIQHADKLARSMYTDVHDTFCSDTFDNDLFNRLGGYNS